MGRRRTLGEGLAKSGVQSLSTCDVSKEVLVPCPSLPQTSALLRLELGDALLKEDPCVYQVQSSVSPLLSRGMGCENRERGEHTLVVVDHDEEGQVPIDELELLAKDLESELKDPRGDGRVLAAVVLNEGCRGDERRERSGGVNWQAYRPRVVEDAPDASNTCQAA